MRYLIYGSGVIGSVFALKLAQNKHNVTMLARGERATQLRENGVIGYDMFSKKQTSAPVQVIEELFPDDLYDYILVTLQKTQVDAVLPFLKKNRSKNIVFIVNNALGYTEWARVLGPDRIMIGFPSAGGERHAGIVRYFIGKGVVRMFQTTTFGEYHQTKTMRVKKIIRDFKQAGIPSVFTKNMDVWQKYHVGIVTSIANILYHYHGDNRALSKSSKDITLMLIGIKEAFMVLRRLNYKVTPYKLNYFRLPVWILRIIFKPVMSMKIAEITMSKHTLNAVSEMSCLQSEFDIFISKSGLDTPAINQLKKYLIEYQMKQ